VIAEGFFMSFKDGLVVVSQHERTQFHALRPDGRRRRFGQLNLHAPREADRLIAFRLMHLAADRVTDGHAVAYVHTQVGFGEFHLFTGAFIQGAQHGGSDAASHEIGVDVAVAVVFRMDVSVGEFLVADNLAVGRFHHPGIGFKVEIRGFPLAG
jgi:hypothetical protein